MNQNDNRQSNAPLGGFVARPVGVVRGAGRFSVALRSGGTTPRALFCPSSQNPLPQRQIILAAVRVRATVGRPRTNAVRGRQRATVSAALLRARRALPVVRLHTQPHTSFWGK